MIFHSSDVCSLSVDVRSSTVGPCSRTLWHPNIVLWVVTWEKLEPAEVFSSGLCVNKCTAVVLELLRTLSLSGRLPAAQPAPGNPVRGSVGIKASHTFSRWSSSRVYLTSAVMSDRGGGPTCHSGAQTSCLCWSSARCSLQHVVPDGSPLPEPLRHINQTLNHLRSWWWNCCQEASGNTFYRPDGFICSQDSFIPDFSGCVELAAGFQIQVYRRHDALQYSGCSLLPEKWDLVSSMCSVTFTVSHFM